MWVENAQRDHADFVNKLVNRGVEVVELPRVSPRRSRRRARVNGSWTGRSSPNEVGIGLVDATGPTWSRWRRQTRGVLIGGLATEDLPEDFRSYVGARPRVAGRA